jgi:hypothetical protein
MNSNFKKVPRDTLRVGILYLVTEINKLLTSKELNVMQILENLLAINESLLLLEITDIHRK